MEVVKIEALTKVYGDKAKVGPINLTVRQGEVYGLVGPNGSGKTTTLRAILGLLKPTSGRVTVFGVDPFKNPHKTNEKIGYSPEIPIFPSFFTADKLLKTTCVMRRIYGRAAEEEVRRILDLTGLMNHAHRKIGNFSKGMVQRLSIGQALVGDPPILVLDEPMLGVDPVGRAHIREVLAELRKQGKTILFSSHELYEVERLSDRVCMVYLGKTVLEEEVKKIVSENRLKSRVVAVLSKKPAEALVAQLQHIDGVLDLEIDGETLFLTVDGVNDPREKIAETIIHSGHGLKELRLVTRTLEDIFINKVKETVGP